MVWRQPMLYLVEQSQPLLPTSLSCRFNIRTFSCRLYELMLKQETSEVGQLNTTSSLASFFSTTALFMLLCALSGAIVGGIWKWDRRVFMLYFGDVQNLTNAADIFSGIFMFYG